MSSPASNSTPSFVVIGQPNEGKSTVLATLTEKDDLEISPIPGATQRCVRYPYSVDGEEVVVFYDTPGFQRPRKMYEWFQSRDDQQLDLARCFLTTFAHTAEFKAECELMKPIADGAAVLYIADASRDVHDSDRQALEVLRKCGNSRIGIINSKDREKPYFSEWQRFMRKDFNHCREFDGHRASFRDRRDLLEAVGAVVPEWRAPMKKVLAAIDADWDRRMREIADAIVDLLAKVMATQEIVTMQQPGDEERARKEAEHRLKERIRKYEKEARRKILTLFRHTEDHWELLKLDEMDLFSEEVWQVFGLTRTQLAVSATIIGALAGLAVDALLLGHSFGLAALIGGAAGGASAWFGSDSAVEVKLPKLGISTPLGKIPLWGGGKCGGRSAIASVRRVSSLPAVLIGRCLSYAELASKWSHGKQGNGGQETPIQSAVSSWPAEGRALIDSFIGHAVKPKPDQEKVRSAREELWRMLKKKLGGDHQLIDLTPARKNRHQLSWKPPFCRPSRRFWMPLQVLWVAWLSVSIRHHSESICCDLRWLE